MLTTNPQDIVLHFDPAGRAGCFELRWARGRRVEWDEISPEDFPAVVEAVVRGIPA